MPSPSYSHTDAELEQIQRDFQPKYEQHWLCLVGGIALAVIGGLMMENGSSNVSLIPILLGLCLLIYASVTWRCPVCRGWIGRNWIGGNCPRCKTRLTK